MGKFVRANRKKLVGLFQIALSLILLVWLLSRVGLGEVVATLARINWYWYALAFLLFQLNVVIRAYRWYVLLRALNDEPRFGYLVYLYYVGFFANNFIPSGFGGDLVKVVTLRQSHGHGSEALSSVLMERVTGPVSYTHLDVYKRQRAGWSSRNQTPRCAPRLSSTPNRSRQQASSSAPTSCVRCSMPGRWLSCWPCCWRRWWRAQWYLSLIHI